MHLRYPTTSWADERIAVSASPLAGRGTFALAPIAAGEIVFVWGGIVFTEAGVRGGTAKPGTIAAVDEGVYLASPADAADHPADFTNHSCDPNLWLAGAVTLVARRAISVGEEVTGDYAMWEAHESYVAAWRCHCASPLCRGRLTGRDWRLRDLQERYRGHFSPFINTRIVTMAEHSPG
jgi:hypothetical protein